MNFSASLMAVAVLFFGNLSFAQEMPPPPMTETATEVTVGRSVEEGDLDTATREIASDEEETPKKETSEEDQFHPDIDEDTPVTHDQIVGETKLTDSRPWQAPNFSGQEGVLGYKTDVFAIPKGLETAVKFWLDIYSKFHSDQGVLHDSEVIEMIYEEIDFTDITTRTDINIYQKEAQKIRRVKQAKARVINTLKKLQKTKDPSTLSEYEKKIWDAFASDKSKKKYLDAAGKNRLRFQLGQKDRVIQGIFFSGRYLEEFEKIFKETGVPLELTRLVFVESSFNVLARSKVGASGLWQIMPYTMKGFMKKDPAVDLRNHPIEATRLSAKLLRNNYNMLQSWPLAVTGYNHGPTGVLRLTKKYKTRELGELVANVASRKRFGFASRNFYASFLAALEVTSSAPKYLGPVSWSQPLDSVDIKTPFPIYYSDILRWFDGDDLKAQVFNPHITQLGRKNRRAIPAKFVISVTKARLESVQKEFESTTALKQAREEYKKKLLEQGIQEALQVPDKEESITHKVRRGETLARIAKNYGVPLSAIIRVNGLKTSQKLRTGQVLKIP